FRSHFHRAAVDGPKTAQHPREETRLRGVYEVFRDAKPRIQPTFGANILPPARLPCHPEEPAGPHAPLPYPAPTAKGLADDTARDQHVGVAPTARIAMLEVEDHVHGDVDVRIVEEDVVQSLVQQRHGETLESGIAHRSSHAIGVKRINNRPR